ncbi:hypothetical protein COL26b_013859 [Colletotrichum chrysophilum]|uniref:Uncharacterized protein n=1 Tax=Colletotrichum chrysophilum TaxID=1836956 RepID=A0AAD9EB06_9PEZI|nr:uncharacterized protein COL26b_013859 [Colletotrichum chrysophilum]KAJ0361106.1 hypothetical protein COL26b_013859 [Colletotrichum chrysophilum]KAK1841533.1 hypothetical protein CCHR01_15832 [Colletotrichum chrysophilum]
MDRKVANEKKTREVATMDWPKMPGHFPKGKTASFDLSEMQKTANSTTKMQAPPASPSPTVTIGDKVNELLQWREGVDQRLDEINFKLDHLLNETLKSRELESQETAMGTKLGNACFRLDSHHETIQSISQSLAAANSQVHRLTNELRSIKEANEVTVTFKSTRPQ